MNYRGGVITGLVAALLIGGFGTGIIWLLFGSPIEALKVNPPKTEATVPKPAKEDQFNTVNLSEDAEKKLGLTRGRAKREAMPASPARHEGPSGSVLKDQPDADKAPAELQAGASPVASAAPTAIPAAPSSSPGALSATAAAAKRADRVDSQERAGRAEQTGKSAQQWLAEIRKLKLEGRAAEADASFREFRKRYPQFPLPDDLQQP